MPKRACAGGCHAHDTQTFDRHVGVSSQESRNTYVCLKPNRQLPVLQVKITTHADTVLNSDKAPIRIHPESYNHHRPKLVGSHIMNRLRLRSSCVALFVLFAGQQVSAAFLESFTTNPEVSNPDFNKAAPFLWVQLGKITPGGRGPVDAANPAGSNSLVISNDLPADETVLMNWDNSTTQLTFYLWAEIFSSCEPYTGLLKVLWSNDSLNWEHLWNRTVAQMARKQYEPVRVAIPAQLRTAPVAFKWVFSTASPCSSSDAIVYMDDITFPTIAPSADNMLLGKAPPAPLPSPAVCSALTAFCKAPGGPAVTLPAPGGRRLRNIV